MWRTFYLLCSLVVAFFSKPYLYIYFFFLSCLAQQPNSSLGRLIFEVSRSHIMTHHSRYDSSGRVIDSSQRSLLDHTQHSHDRHPCPRWDSNPQFQQVIGRRPLGHWYRIYVYTGSDNIIVSNKWICLQQWFCVGYVYTCVHTLRMNQI